MNYYPNFKFVEVGNAQSKWERTLLADLENYRAKFSNTNFCKSIARYANQEHQDKESMLMGITIDLDSEDLEEVLTEARLLREHFYGKWELKKEEVRFYYSGNRSIHIEIRPETLGISPHEKSYLYVKEAVRAIADNLELNCIDYSIYAKRHLFRCVGTIHSKTGKFKVELDPYELSLQAEDLKKLADTNRGSLYQEQDLDLTKNETASKYFNAIFEPVRKGVDESNFRGSSIENLSLLKGISQYPACVRDILDNSIVIKGTRNRAVLTLACFFKDTGKNKDETIQILTPWVKTIPVGLTATDEKKRLEQMESTVNFVFSEAGRDYHFACPFILSLGTSQYAIKCKSRCQLHINKETRTKIKEESEPENRILTAYIPEVGGFLIDLVYDPLTKKPKFAVYDPSKDKVSYVEEVAYDYPTIYVPSIDENVFKGSVLLPSSAEEYGSDEDLYKLVINVIAKYYNEPKKTYITLNALYVIFSWLYDRFPSWCYLQFLGAAGGGKSRGLWAIGHLCYRPILLCGGDSSACMLRMLDKYRGTAVIDEASFTNKSEVHAAIVQILNVGYKIEGTVGRCEGDNNQPMRYMVGGPKILATREDFYDDGLRSRCVVKRTGRDNRIKEGENKQPVILTEAFKQDALALRNKLLMFRFRHYKEAKLNLDLEIKDVQSRINEIIMPILSVMNNETVRQDIEEVAREQQEDLKQQRQATLEGEILGVIQEMGFDYKDILPFEICDAINKDRKVKFVSTHSVTKAIKKMELKLKKYGNRWVLRSCPENNVLLEKLFRDYGLVGAPADETEDQETATEVNVEESKEDSKDVDLFTLPPEES